MAESTTAAPLAPPITPLRDHLQPHWPAMVQRLGARWTAFEGTVRERAARHGIVGEAALARYAGLCLSFGPGFEDRPEHEWALALLADERLGEWVKLHQAVLRAVDTLTRPGEGDAQALARADAALVDQLVNEAGVDADLPPRLPRVACDLEALDLRLLPADWRQHYQRAEGRWQRVPAPPPASLRVDAQRPLPQPLHLLSHAPGEGPAALLQLRQIVHGGCSGGHHPAVRWLDARGVQQWQGHEAKAVSWPVNAMAQPPAPNGFGSALVEETSPTVHLLEVHNCGLRDQGRPLGAQQAAVWAWPAHQWLMAWQRQPTLAWAWPQAAHAAPPAAASATRVRLERDGLPVAAPAWRHGFDEELPAALRRGLDTLFQHWQQAVQSPSMQCEAAPLAGHAVLAWGWCEAAGGLAERPLMRLLGELDLHSTLQLSLLGEVDVAGSRTQLRLQAQGSGVLTRQLERVQAQPPLLDTLLPATVQWRCPFTVDFDPIAQALPVVCAQAGPCSGALVGEAGLRPRSGGSGWQWFLRLNLEPVMLPMLLHDPVLGQQRRNLALLPGMTLLDWSVG